MSDVEDYAYSPYDDLEDILWDADPAPELADDLADHAIHSPIYNDEDAVKGELQDYFSDWEYYSDDYMDDDPSLLRKNPQDGSPLKKATQCKQPVKRGKKRKLVDTQDIPPLALDEDDLLTRCIKGTVWAESSQLQVPHYRDGQEKKVALMKDWKQVFAVKNNGWGKKADEEDESWAKDMSLADMGLRNLPRQTSFEQTTGQGEEVVDDEEEIEEDEAEAEELEDMVTDEGREAISLKSNTVPGSSKLRMAMLQEEDDGGGSIQNGLEEEEAPRKRRRVKPELPSPPDSNEAVAVGTNGFDPGPPTNNSDSSEQNEAAKPTPSTAPQGRKRKAAEEPPETGSSTSTSRAKRVASTAARKENSLPTTTRATRSTRTK